MTRAPARASLGWVLWSVLYCATPCVAQSDAPTALIARLDSTAAAMLEALSLSSAGVAVVHGRDALLLRGYGLADRENKRPATAATVYEIASITKQVTAAAIMRLVERGKVGARRLHGRTSAPLEGHQSFRARYESRMPGRGSIRPREPQRLTARDIRASE